VEPSRGTSYVPQPLMDAKVARRLVK